MNKYGTLVSGEWITLSEASRRLRLNKDTVKRMLADAGVEVLKTRGSYRINTNELERVINGNLIVFGGNNE